MAQMDLKPFDELLDELYGKSGTLRRDDFERAVDADVKAWEMGEAIRKARQERHLTQEELGERIGEKKAQISRIEKGRNLTIGTLSRVFKALGIPASLDVAGVGKVALW